MECDPTSLAEEIMQDFAGLTGLLQPGISPKRYLWTDAFAVCNYLGLYRRTDDAVYLDLALRLVNQVHHVLGRHRDDDTRIGWISGLPDQAGELHPTAGGLRIGKRLNERKPGEPPDERLEWDRDGQYYHYLTKWMHSLNCVSRVTRDRIYTTWAIELAKIAHARFTRVNAGGLSGLSWKMSIDLSHPLVGSMGMHDPLDGLVTFSELQMAAVSDHGTLARPGLDSEIADLAEMCRGQDWVTDDPLATGGLLFDASRIGQLVVRDGFSYPEILEPVLESALTGLKAISRSSLLRVPSTYRLAFRETGLSIGLKSIERLAGQIEENPASFYRTDHLLGIIRELSGFKPLSERIEQFWLDEKNQEASTWKEHEEINTVMLATSLVPEEFLAV